MQSLKRNVAIVALWSSSGSRAHVRWATVSYHLNSSFLLDMIQNLLVDLSFVTSIVARS